MMAWYPSPKRLNEYTTKHMNLKFRYTLLEERWNAYTHMVGPEYWADDTIQQKPII